MKNSALASVLFHIFLFVLFLVGIPFSERQSPVIEQPFIVEFEQIGPKSTAPALTPKASLKSTTEDKKDIKKAPPPPKEDVKEEPKTEPAPAPKPEPKEEKTPPKKVEEPKPEPSPEKKQDTDPLPKKDVKKDPPKESKKEPKKEAPKKDIKKDTPKKAEVNLDPKKAKPLSKAKPLADKKTSSVDDLLDQVLDDKATSGGENSERGAPASMVGDKITATDIDAVRSQIAKCWLIPLGGQDARDMIVDVRMDIAPDGTVQKADVVNSRANDPAFQAAAESAQRAVLDPACNPLPLPPEKYEKWKRLTLRFNPKDMY